MTLLRLALVLLALALLSAGAGAARDIRAEEPRPFSTRQAEATSTPGRRASPEVTISATGDITLGRNGRYPTGGSAALLRGLRRHLAGDLVLGNLETVLGDTPLARRLGAAPSCGGSPDTCFNFIAPGSFAHGLRASGFTLLNVANNHAYDYGVIGESMTVGSLARAGLRWTGRPGYVARVRVNGVRIAVIGAAPYPWAQNLLDVDGTARLVRRASTSADIVIVTAHLGAEGAGCNHVRLGMEAFLDERRGDPIRFAHAMVDAGADLVIGHGPHVLRGLEWYRHRLIAYSLGNFSGFHTLSTSGALGVSAVLHVRLIADGRFVRGSITPVRLDAAGTPRLDATHSAWRLVRQLSRADFGRRSAPVSSKGAISARPASRDGRSAASASRRRR